MKITRMKFKDDNPILRGLSLDFTNEKGEPYNNIVLAGENGIGKSTILKSIFNLFYDESYDFETFDYIENEKTYQTRFKSKDVFEVSEDRVKYSEVQIKHKNTKQDNIIFLEAEEPETVPNNRKVYYSEAASEFETSRGESYNLNVHDIVHKRLIALQSQDNESYRKENFERGNRGEPLLTVSDFDIKHSLVQKFKKAFNLVFEKLRFDGISSSAETTNLLFTKGNQNNIDIDSLSTGEKQIVFRGSYLLNNAAETDVALIDEPEISMHPRWLKKILSFYKSLYMDSSAKQQTTQLFFTTHSDQILASALKETDTKEICLGYHGASDKVIINGPLTSVLPAITIAETNFIVFGIYSIDYHIQLFNLLHSNIDSNKPGNNGNTTIKNVDASIKGQNQYDKTKHYKKYEHQHPKGITEYDTLPCYVRNSIDHPDSPDRNKVKQNFNDEELRVSIDFLRELICEQKNGNYDYSK